MLLYELLRANAERFPGKPAARFAATGEAITFGDLDALSDRVAAHLAAHGVGPGDRVAIMCGNNLPALVWFWGVLKAGAATVDVPQLAGRATIQAVLDEAAPKALCIDAAELNKQLHGDTPLRLPPMVLSTVDAGELTAVHALENIFAGTADVPQPQVTADDVALIVYTSGTTGRPNGVMLSHDNFISNLTASNDLMGLSADDSILVVVPLYYIHGRMQLLLHALLGGTVVFSAGFQFPQRVLDELSEFGTSGFSGVPYHFKQLLDRSKLAKTPPPALKYVLITGGALAPAELRRLSDAMPNVGIHLAYGQTEAAPRITWIGPAELFDKQGSVGRALPGVTVELLGRDERPVGAGEVGEVAAGGPNIMKGYVSGDHRELGKIDTQGRLRTGDLGRLDDDGHLFLVGRSSEMIKVAGERIFPQEIEAVLLAHPRVSEAAVIGVKDPLLGERIVSYLVADDAVTAADLKQHCLKSLPFVRIPRAFDIVDELPKTASGKVNRAALRKSAAEP